MIEGATVTLPLNEFDGLRADGEEYRRLAPRLAACFDYKFKDNGEPAKCKTCKKENPDCTKCKVFKESPPWEEMLIVDVERLIRVCKEYALYVKSVEGDVDEMALKRKEDNSE